MENGSLGCLQMDTHTRGGGGGGGGGGVRQLSCFAHSVCAALHGIGLWDLQS